MGTRVRGGGNDGLGNWEQGTKGLTSVAKVGGRGLGNPLLTKGLTPVAKVLVGKVGGGGGDAAEFVGFISLGDFVDFTSLGDDFILSVLVLIL